MCRVSAVPLKEMQSEMSNEAIVTNRYFIYISYYFCLFLRRTYISNKLFILIESNSWGCNVSISFCSRAGYDKFCEEIE
jgi:ABC-type arginine transport system permease subunit